MKPFHGNHLKHIRLTVILFSILSVLLIGATSGFAQEKKAEQPVAHFGERMFDFGTLVDGQKIVHDFVITNKGAVELKIENVKTD